VSITKHRPVRVYLADLRHNWAGIISTDCMPLSVGYMKAVMDRDLPSDEVTSQIFSYPADLVEAIDENAPEIVMVSNYMWNEALGRQALRRAKRLNPNAITVMGGPNIPVEAERQIEFVQDRPEIDIYVLGEGDFLAAQIVRAYLENNRHRERTLEAHIPSCVRRSPAGLIRTEQAPRTGPEDINNIPSPWLTGVMDPCFDGKLAPLLETNRGCPFSCSFCVQGTNYYTKITNFTLDRIKAEIEYIGHMIYTKSPSVGTLRLADANYGMYPRDTDISGYIGDAQLKYGWPTFLDATTGKNRAENIIRSMEKVHGGMVLYQAVQSLDENVLKNVRRSNIKLSAYSQLSVFIRGRGMRTSTDLILGLPGESLKTHLNTLMQMIDAGTDSAHCFQAMMLKGSDMESLETRRQFDLRAKYRLGPKNFGVYGGETVLDIEEIVVETESMPFSDYLEARRNHVTFSMFWNDSWYNDVTALLKHWNITNSEWLAAILEGLKADEGEAGDLLRRFEAETRGELFDTKEELIAYYSDPETFEKLQRGEVGDNLMYRYRALAAFFHWPAMCRLAMNVTLRLIQRKNPDAADLGPLWKDFARFVEVRHAHGGSIKELVREQELSLEYDIPAWLADGGPFDIAPYRLNDTSRLIFRLPADRERELRNAFDVWTEKVIGLSKLITRIRHPVQVRSFESADGRYQHLETLEETYQVKAIA
jgi:radical SAM superfamily enzyme YgiQ (UPF0313 family)